MDSPSLKERLKERRLDRMRQGQAVCEYVTLLSDPEVRIAIVPLTEAEYEKCIERAASISAQTSNLMSVQLQERIQTRELVFRAIREDGDLSKQAFADSDEMTSVLEPTDINHIFDHYLEMVDKSSPSIEGIPKEEFEALKKAFARIDLSELSGKQWYALRRFLSSISPTPLLDKSPGFGLTNLSMRTNEGQIPVLSALNERQQESAPVSPVERN